MTKGFLDEADSCVAKAMFSTVEFHFDQQNKGTSTSEPLPVCWLLHDINDRGIVFHTVEGITVQHLSVALG